MLPKPKRKGAWRLPERKHEAFKTDCATLSDSELAKKYKLSERTATNWRLRLYGDRPYRQEPTQ